MKGVNYIWRVIRGWLGIGSGEKAGGEKAVSRSPSPMSLGCRLEATDDGHVILIPTSPNPPFAELARVKLNPFQAAALARNLDHLVNHVQHQWLKRANT